ncbi:proline/glycine betaine ABC transporter permease [Roseovarius sp. THAF9]|uniref:ABC transporter permease n=1 Tax=Roseovarius sp. THAF9 TaxID=2587847 RepID=UPI0012682383|nr:ABC transporter permease subunit [Roseovarius sp. THAF9]
MTIQSDIATVPDGPRRLGRGALAALIVLATGAICMALTPYLSWLVKFPEAWTLPVTEWVDAGVGWFLNLIKPLARVFSSLLTYPMDWANAFWTQTHWLTIVAGITALGWFIGGTGYAVLGLIGMIFVLATGFWVEGMRTLALVTVSVPLALIAGAATGILANEIPRLKPAVQATLDVMQTVPTFAYLTPLLVLFGFGPVVGLIASAIYAAPPMARNVLLGLERVEPDIKEAAVMSGGNRIQQLFLVELPSAKAQIMVGVNQCLMAALSMVIIAAVIGGFDDIGWEVLLTMRKAQFGPSLLAGFVIVVFAVIIDRMSGKLAEDQQRHDIRVALALFLLGVGAALVFGGIIPESGTINVLQPVAGWLDTTLSKVLAANAATLDTIKNGAMYYVLLPLRIGFDGAVLPFTWGFQWTSPLSATFFAGAAILAILGILRGKITLGLVIFILAGVLETGITDLPWPFVLIAAAMIGWVAGGRSLSVFSALMLAFILFSGLWDQALLSIYLSGASVFTCALLGGGIGLICAVSPLAWRVMRPVCDMLQTIPLFVFLIPVLMFFQIGEFSAFLAICLYAIVPMIRYTRHGLISTPDELVEAAVSSGATQSQTLFEIRLPYAVPTILLGLNQTILYAFAMLVIAALIGTTGLGQSIYLALGQADVGLGITAGAAMAVLAIVADRLVQGFATEKRRALGL